MKNPLHRPIMGRRIAAAVATTAMVVLVLSGVDALADMELIESEVVTSVSGIWVEDDSASMRRRHGIPDDDVMGGIESLRMEWFGDEGESATIEGRAIADNNDYTIALELSYPDKGFVSAGYKEFRTYYEDGGGFFPPSGEFLRLSGNGLELDHGRSWFEAGLRLPGSAPVTLRYDHLFRDGQKSSTIWGDSGLTAGLGTRAFAPAFRGIDENRDIVELKISKELSEWAQTEVGLGLTYESTKLDDSLNFARRPGEMGSERLVTQREEVDSDSYNVHAFSTTPLADGRARVSTSYSYTNLKNDLGSDRIYGSTFGAAYDPALANRQPFDDEGFLDLDGTTKLQRHVGSLSWVAQATESIRVTLRLRGEGTDIDGDSRFTETNVGFPPALLASSEDLSVRSDSNGIKVAERLEVRHTGFEDVVLYARADFEQADIDLKETETEVATSTVDLERDTDADLSARKYTIGAIWYPHTRFNIGGRYRYVFRENDYMHKVDSTSDNTSADRFPAYITAQNVTTQSGDLRATWRAHDTLRLTARYDVAYTEISNRSEELSHVDAGKLHTHMVSASSTWTPIAQMYVQTDAGYVRSRTDTPANAVGGAAGGTVTDFHNDYWNGTVIVGLAVDDYTDVEARYFYYRADNYSDNSAFSQPYGADSEEHGASISVKQQWTDALATRLGTAWFKSDDDASGGNNDYQVSVVTGSMEVKF